MTAQAHWPGPQNPTVTVVIVTHESKSLALECLASLEDAAAGIPHETFVVDNASTDATPEAVARAFPAVQVIARSHNDGFAVANNEALRRARGRYTLLLNPDTRVLPGALEAMIEFLDEHPRTGIVGCRLVDRTGNVDASAGGLPGFRIQVASWFGFKRLAPRAAVHTALKVRPLSRILELCAGGYFTPAAADSGPQEVNFLSGACVLVRGELWDRVGLFDERFFLFLEDADICRRAAAAGWRLHYLPGHAIVHLGGRSFATRSGGGTHHVSAERAQSLVYYFRKHGGRGQELAIRGVITVAVVPRLLLALVRGDHHRTARLRSILGITMTPLPSPKP